MASPPSDPHIADPSSASTIAAAPDLYTALQANRALKDAEEAEKIKFKNSFRGLEADEAEFLDGILEEERKKEREKKEEERRELGRFRKTVEEVEKDSNLKIEESAGDVNWRKRKAADGGKSKRLKLVGRKKSDGEEKKETADTKESETKTTNGNTKQPEPSPPSKTEATPQNINAAEKVHKDAPKPAPAGLGGLLGDYDSDESG